MVLKMKDTNSACLSAVPHVPHLAKFLMPFYKCWAGAGWQQCKRPFLTQGVGRWFQRYWFFESGFCPDCVWFLPFRPPLLTNEMTQVLLPFMPSTECSDLDSGNPNLVFKLSKSQYSDTTTYCKIQLIAKSNLLHLTRSYLFIVKSTNQISRCFNHCARSRRAWPKPLCRWTSLHKMGTEFSFFFISAPLTPAPMPCWNSQLLQEQSPLSKLSHFDHSLLF